MNLLQEYKRNLLEVRQETFSSLTDANLLIDTTHFSSLHYELLSILIKRNSFLLTKLQSSCDETVILEDFLENIKWYVDNIYQIETTNLNISFQIAVGNQYIQRLKRKITSMNESKQNQRLINLRPLSLSGDMNLNRIRQESSYSSITCGEALIANTIMGNCMKSKEENVELKEISKTSPDETEVLKYYDKINTLSIAIKSLLNLLSSSSSLINDTHRAPSSCVSSSSSSSSLVYTNQMSKVDAMYLLELLKKLDDDVSKVFMRYDHRKRCIDLLLSSSSSSSTSLS